MAGTSLHRFYVKTPKMIHPGIFLCNGQPHQLHRKGGFPSVISWRAVTYMKTMQWAEHSLPQNCIYVCNVFEGRGSHCITEWSWCATLHLHEEQKDRDAQRKIEREREIHIYIYMLWRYYLGQVWPFEGLLSGPSEGYYLGQVCF